MIKRATLLRHLTPAEHFGLYVQLIVAYKLGLAFFQYGPVAQVLLIGRTPHLFLVLKRFVVLLFVGGETILAEDELGEVKREAIRIFEGENVHTGDLRLALFLSLIHQFLQEVNALIKGAEEPFFLALDYWYNLFLLLLQLGVGSA